MKVYIKGNKENQLDELLNMVEGSLSRGCEFYRNDVGVVYVSEDNTLIRAAMLPYIQSKLQSLSESQLEDLYENPETLLEYLDEDISYVILDYDWPEYLKDKYEILSKYGIQSISKMNRASAEYLLNDILHTLSNDPSNTYILQYNSKGVILVYSDTKTVRAATTAYILDKLEKMSRGDVLDLLSNPANIRKLLTETSILFNDPNYSDRLNSLASEYGMNLDDFYGE